MSIAFNSAFFTIHIIYYMQSHTCLPFAENVASQTSRLDLRSIYAGSLYKPQSEAITSITEPSSYFVTTGLLSITQCVIRSVIIVTFSTSYQCSSQVEKNRLHADE
jgi:hypothetical protein